MKNNQENEFAYVEIVNEATEKPIFRYPKKDITGDIMLKGVKAFASEKAPEGAYTVRLTTSDYPLPNIVPD